MELEILSPSDDWSSGPRYALRAATGDDLDAAKRESGASILIIGSPPHADMSLPKCLQVVDAWAGPILIVPDGSGLTAPPNLRRIILATSNISRLQPLSDCFTDVATRARSHMMLLSVFDPDDAGREPAAQARFEEVQRRLARAASRLRSRGIMANWEIRFGPLGEEVARLAETTGAEIAAVQRPAPGEDSDFARLCHHIRQSSQHLLVLLSPLMYPTVGPDVPLA